MFGENVEKLDFLYVLDSVYMFLLLFYGKEYKYFLNLIIKIELLFDLLMDMYLNY